MKNITNRPICPNSPIAVYERSAWCKIIGHIDLE